MADVKMNHAGEMLDISIFPEDVKRQILDFYSFLSQKYTIKKKKTKQATSAKLPDEFYKPIKVERSLKPDR